MFTVIKVFAFLASPVVLIIIILCVAHLLGQRHAILKRRLSLLALLMLLIFSSPFTASTLLSSLEQKLPTLAVSEVPVADTIILLAGGVDVPYAPRKAAELGARGDRLLLTHRLWKAGKAPRIIVSGGNVYNGSGIAPESEHTKDILTAWGIPPTQIYIETASRNTKQSAANLEDVVAELEVQSVLLVTSAYHMPRSYQLLRNIADTVVPVPANHLIVEHDRPTVFNFIPSSTSLDGSTLALYEYLGMLVNYLAAAASHNR